MSPDYSPFGLNRYLQLTIRENNPRVRFLPRGAIYWRAYIGESGCTKCLLGCDLRAVHCQIKRPFVKICGRVLQVANLYGRSETGFEILWVLEFYWCYTLYVMMIELVCLNTEKTEHNYSVDIVYLIRHLC